jgi:hypothetical protein
MLKRQSKAFQELLAELGDKQVDVNNTDCWVQDSNNQVKTCFLAVITKNKYNNINKRKTYREHLLGNGTESDKVHDIYNPLVYTCVFGNNLHHVLAKSTFEMEEGYIFKVPLKCNGNDLRLMYDGLRTRDDIHMLLEETYHFLHRMKNNIADPFGKKLSAVVDTNIVENARTSHNVTMAYIEDRHCIQNYFGCYHHFLWNSRLTFNEVFWCMNTVMAPGPDDYSRELLIPISAVEYLLTYKNRYPHIKIS